MKTDKTTLGDVANLAGVSKSTASRILNSRPADQVPFDPKTQERVRRAAAVLGYVPSRLAQGLTKKRTGIIGLIVPSIEDSFFPGVTSIIEQQLAEHGCNIILVNTGGKAETEQAKIADLLAWQVDGLIIAPSQETMDATVFWELWRRKTRFVLIDRCFPDTPFFSVTTDDHAGAVMAVEHLASIGCTRIARAGAQSVMHTSRLRDRGYRETLGRRGLSYDPALSVDVPSSAEGGRLAIRQLLALDVPPDALFCFSDLVAAGAMEECLTRGVRIPEDLALVGYADLAHSQMLRVPLTTVRQPMSLLGQAAAAMLLALLEGRTPGTAQVVLPVALVPRASTGPSETTQPRSHEETGV